jgi:hypothetical protein
MVSVWSKVGTTKTRRLLSNATRQEGLMLQITLTEKRKRPVMNRLSNECDCEVEQWSVGDNRTKP